MTNYPQQSPTSPSCGGTEQTAAPLPKTPSSGNPFSSLLNPRRLTGATQDPPHPHSTPSGKRFSSIIKVKTMGDVVLIAGPFDPCHTPEQAARELLDAVTCIACGLADIAQVDAGLHVGPVVGCVLGLNRLAFDIFGDTVNTASRLYSAGGKRARSEGTDVQPGIANAIVHASLPFVEMVSASINPISATDQTFQPLNSAPQQAPQTSTPSYFSAEVVSLNAKGKGTLLSRRLIGVPK
jgi:hypothetical protein